MSEPTIEILPLEAFRPDPANANQGTAFGLGMTETSMRERGAARSFVATSDGQIFIGNHSHEAALNAGMTDAIVVHSDGTRPVIVVRDDLSAGDDAARILAVEDNRASEVGLAWNPVMLKALQDEQPKAMKRMFGEEGVAMLMAAAVEPAIPEPGEQQEPHLKAAHMVEIYCNADDLEDFRSTLAEWGQRKSVTINIS